MKKIVSKAYAGYPEQPYISPDRDLVAWEKDPDSFHYGKVARKQMERLPEGFLPGDLVMLWRIHFGTFTNESVIPAYFEYRYGVDSDESIETLLDLGYIEVLGARDSVTSLTVPRLKKILEANGLETKGSKADLLRRIDENVDEATLAKQYLLRRYAITPKGSQVLKKYDSIIQEHGPKM